MSIRIYSLQRSAFSVHADNGRYISLFVFTSASLLNNKSTTGSPSAMLHAIIKGVHPSPSCQRLSESAPESALEVKGLADLDVGIKFWKCNQELDYREVVI